MNIEQWSLILGVVLTAVVGLGPWMFMVHAKLAVIATQIIELNDKVQRTNEAHHELVTACTRHETQLQTHELKFTHIDQRLQEL